MVVSVRFWRNFAERHAARCGIDLAPAPPAYEAALPRRTESANSPATPRQRDQKFFASFLQKRRTFLWSFPMSLSGRVALITGASRGIGRAAAIQLAAQGAHVVLVARTQGGLEEADDEIRAAGGTATLLPLDLKAADSIDPLGPSLHARFGRLDILVHAAAVLGRLTPAGHLTPKDFNECVAVNLTATYRLIRTLAPLLVASDAGRAVFLTSGVAREPRAFWTKAGMENLVLSWADEVEKTSLRVNVFDPGRTATRMRAQAFPGEDPNTLPRPDEVARHLVPLCLVGFEGHGTLVRAAVG
jgi:NAD(P)-dependent dehydrogenase (short-subunit alcohol dehydrogenase family)